MCVHVTHYHSTTDHNTNNTVHTPGDRSHVIEKRHNVKSQCREEHQEFVNIDEGNAKNSNCC